MEYIAFGETFVEEHSNTDRTPYLFNGKELDEETGLYYYGARYYDPRTSIWQSVDPLAEKMPAWSPFTYTFNNPIIFIDPDGAFPIQFQTRAFAPFDWFGMNGWKGDGNNRKFSTAADQGFRIAQTTSYETTTQIAKNEALGAMSLSAYGASAFSEAEVSPLKSRGNRLVSHLSGDNDALIPGLDGLGFGSSPTWDIDVHTDFTVNVIDGKDGNQIMNITGNIGGDLFPSVESFVNDSEGNGVFLGVVQANYGATDGPFRGLGGDKRSVGTSVNVSIVVNKKGHFIGVMQNGKMIGVQQWNKQFEKKDPVNVGANKNGG